jgi:hypothetical protein
MFVLGAGLGMVMQVLVLAVQNAVEYRDLGVGTSGATFFRTIGSCVGVAVLGTLFTSHLTSALATAPPEGAVGPCSAETLSATSATLATCPPAVQDWFLDGYSEAIHTIFLYAVPVGALAFVLSWLIPEVTLRTAAHVPEQGEVYALPSSRTSYEELRLLLWREVGHQDPLRAYAVVVRDLDVDLTPGQCWMLARVTATGSRTVDAMVESSHVDRDRVVATAEALRTRGLVAVDDGVVTPTPGGLALADRVRDHERDLLRRMVDEWEGSDEPALDVLVEQVTERLWRDDPSPAGLRA